jgi:hypothetical protein
MSWSPEELQILFAADSPRDQTHGVYAALLEQDATRPDPIMIIEGTYALEESWIDARENTNPQWQPRP